MASAGTGSVPSAPGPAGPARWPAGSAEGSTASADDIGVLYFLTGPQLGHPSLGDDLALVHDHHRFAQALDDPQLVLDEQDGHPAAGQLAAGRLPPLGPRRRPPAPRVRPPAHA